MFRTNRQERRIPVARLIIMAAACGCAMSALAWAQGNREVIWKADALGQPVVALDISPDGTLVAAGSIRRRHLALLRMEDGAQLGRFRMGGNARVLQFSPDGALLAAAGSFVGITVWRLPDRVPIYTIPAAAGSFSISPDGELLAAPGGDGVNFYRVSDGSLVGTWNTGSVTSLTYSPDGALLATVTGASAKVWRVSDGVLLRTLSHGNAITAIAFSPDSLVLGTAGREVKLWGVADGALLATLRGHFSTNCLSFSPDGQYLVTGGRLDPDLILWNLEDGSRVRTSDRERTVNSIQFAPDGKAFAFGHANGNIFLARNPASGDCKPVADLSVTCNDDGTEVTAELKQAYRNSIVTFTLDGDNPMEVMTDPDGRATVTYTGVAPGAHRVNVCHLQDECP